MQINQTSHLYIFFRYLSDISEAVQCLWALGYGYSSSLALRFEVSASFACGSEQNKVGYICVHSFLVTSAI